MKKLVLTLSIILLISMIAGTFSVSAATYTGDVIVMAFNTKDSVKDLTTDDKLTNYYILRGDTANLTGPQGIMKFDEGEKSVYIDSIHDGAKGTADLYMLRINIVPKTADYNFNCSDYPYVKIKFKYVINNNDNLVKINLRNNNFTSFLVADIPNTNVWIEKVLDLSADAGWNATEVATNKALRVQIQHYDTGFSYYEHPDARLYVQYIALFENKTDAENFKFESASDTTAATTTAAATTTTGSQSPNTFDSLAYALMTVAACGVGGVVIHHRCRRVRGK